MASSQAFLSPAYGLIKPRQYQSTDQEPSLYTRREGESPFPLRRLEGEENKTASEHLEGEKKCFHVNEKKEK